MSAFALFYALMPGDNAATVPANAPVPFPQNGPTNVVGRGSGTTRSVGNTLVTTVSPYALLEVINPPGNVPALTIAPVAGGNASRFGDAFDQANPLNAELREDRPSRAPRRSRRAPARTRRIARCERIPLKRRRLRSPPFDYSLRLLPTPTETS